MIYLLANGVTTYYTLIDDKVTYETNGTNNIYYYYDSDSNLVSFNLNVTQYFYIRNLQGDITGILDKDGNIVAEYTYDAWGKLLSRHFQSPSFFSKKIIYFNSTPFFFHVKGYLPFHNRICFGN